MPCNDNPANLNHFILLAGDVEKNPGPKCKWPCGKYSNLVAWKGYSIFCQDCKKWVHME